MQLLTTLEKEHEHAKQVDHFDVGDMVEVHVWIKEGDKRRVQVFTGLVTRMKHGRGLRGTFTVRRIVSGLGVERIFPLHSPNIEKVVVTRYGKVRRAKLYYLRERIGKEALKVKELMGGRRKKRLAGQEEEKKVKVKKRGKKAKAERRARLEAEGKVPPKGKGRRKKRRPGKGSK